MTHLPPFPEPDGSTVPDLISVDELDAAGLEFLNAVTIAATDEEAVRYVGEWFDAAGDWRWAFIALSAAFATYASWLFTSVHDELFPGSLVRFAKVLAEARRLLDGRRPPGAQMGLALAFATTETDTAA